MSEALDTYRCLENELVRIRWIHRGAESPEEDEHLEKMDAVWSRLSPEDQALASAEPVRSLVRESPIPTRTVVDEDVWVFRELPPRRKEAAQCI
ncbi:MAG: hypothetical protein IPK82_11185 [Polyangiaceae bacterium]|nr:hypothetical protein [Polyangiaceae bacterium]